MYGSGVGQDKEQATEWYRKSADQGNTDAQTALGVFFEEEENYQSAVYWFKKAANKGNVKAQSRLGYLYYMGTGIKQDYQQAVQWLKKSAGQGDILGQFILGLCFRRGQGVASNDNQAMFWFKKAAEQGNEHAQYELGQMYMEKGDFGNILTQGNKRKEFLKTKDGKKMIMYYEQAAASGHEDAKKALENWRKYM